MTKMTDEERQAHIERLGVKRIVELEQVKLLHNWFDKKRTARKACRVIGASRTGKTSACKAYKRCHPFQRVQGQKLIAPVAYIQPPQDCSAREFYRALLREVDYAIPKGTVGDIRNRTLTVFKECQTELIIIDEADRLPRKTFAEIRDLYDKLEIAIALVATDILDRVLTVSLADGMQTYNRFRSVYPFGTLSPEDFKTTVALWERDILNLPVASNLISPTKLKILQHATQYYLGPLDELLRESAIRALEKGKNSIDIATLKEVARENS